MNKLENKKSTKPSKATKSTKEEPTKISKNWLELEKVNINHENEGFFSSNPETCRNLFNGTLTFDYRN